MILAVVSLCFLAGYALLILFYYRHWKRLGEYGPEVPSGAFVSVIIAARNEETTLPLLVQDLQQQTHPTHLFEVLIVDDFSTDATAQLLNTLPPNFRMLHPDGLPEHSSKKKAITKGVAESRGELLLITDADCRVGPKWITTVASFYERNNAAFIAAPVRFTGQNTLVEWLQVLDFITLQGITAASVSARFHTMCNGANLAYTKTAFNSVGGFRGIDQVPTGDDMLLMHKIWKKDPAAVYYLKSKEAVVSTAPMGTWKEFLMQRRRWASKTLVYDDYRIIAVLGFVLVLNLLPFLLLVASLFHAINVVYLLHFFLAKSVIEWPFVFSVAQFFNQQKLMRYFFLLQPLHVLYTVVVGIWSQVGTYQWKGRTANRRGVAG
jgi:cellulose synthase/poly-beta-1,6-N-acetylglucosamine synthase-like glycosyltransferase